MTLSTALKSIFLKHPEKFLTANQIKELIRDNYSFYPRKSEWERTFLPFRETQKWKDGYSLCKIRLSTGIHYILTKSEGWKQLHNKSIHKQQQTLETRKIEAA